MKRYRRVMRRAHPERLNDPQGSLRREIRRRRRVLGLTQADVAELLGLNRSVYARMELHQRLPYEVLCRLAGVYGCSVGELMAAAGQAWVMQMRGGEDGKDLDLEQTGVR